MFEDEIGGVQIIIESQSRWRPNEAITISLAPSFGAPGSPILAVVAQGLKKHKLYIIFTAKLGILQRNLVVVLYCFEILAVVLLLS